MKINLKYLIENKEKFFLQIFEKGNFDLTIMCFLNIIADNYNYKKSIAMRCR